MTMNQEDLMFLHSIKEYVKKRPEVAAHIGDYAGEGLREFAHDQRCFAIDMETCALAAITKKYKGRAEIILQKIKKQKHNLGFDWENIIPLIDDKA
jgi:hypothetical protein